MDQPTAEPTRKVAAGITAGGGVVAITTGLVAAGLAPAEALAGAIVATVLTIVAAYVTPERG